MDVEDVFERYCVLTSGRDTTTRGTPTSIASRLICSIPVVVEGNKVKVQHVGRRRGSLCSKLWTQIYAPRQAEQVMGNSEASQMLVEWLQCWVLSESDSTKPAGDSQLARRRKLFMMERHFSNRSCTNIHGKATEEARPQMYCSSDDSDDDDEVFPLAALLHGPHGCGKTSAVYACALQLGLEVSVQQQHL